MPKIDKSKGMFLKRVLSCSYCGEVPTPKEIRVMGNMRLCVQCSLKLDHKDLGAVKWSPAWADIAQCFTEIFPDFAEKSTREQSVQTDPQETPTASMIMALTIQAVKETLANATQLQPIVQVNGTAADASTSAPTASSSFQPQPSTSGCVPQPRASRDEQCAAKVRPSAANAYAGAVMDEQVSAFFKRATAVFVGSWLHQAQMRVALELHGCIVQLIASPEAAILHKNKYTMIIFDNFDAFPQEQKDSLFRLARANNAVLIPCQLIDGMLSHGLATALPNENAKIHELLVTSNFPGWIKSARKAPVCHAEVD